YLDWKRSMTDNMGVLESRLHSRLPLCDGGMDNVFGVVHTKEFLLAYSGDGDPSVMQLIARPPVFVPETLTVDKLLPIFSAQGTQMLLLVSEYGGVEGIVTLKDVVDELLRGAGVRSDLPVAADAHYFLDIGAGLLKLHARVRVVSTRLRRDGSWDVGTAFCTVE